MTRRWRWMAALAVAGVVVVVLLAEDSATFKVDVSVVNILASVRDHEGKIVSDLGKDDFVLEENGKAQEIRYFSRQTDLPMLVGLLVDTSVSQRRLIQNERDASYKFFEQVLRPENDVAFVIRFDSEVELLQDLTNSRPLLETALNDLEVRGGLGRTTAGSGRSHWQGWPGGTQWPGGGTGWPGGRGGRDRQPRPGGGGPGGQQGRIAGGTALYDSVNLAADEVLRQKTGRKAIILISDGVDTGSKVSQSSAIEAAQRADAIVYSIRYYDADAYAGRRFPGGNQNSDGIAALKSLASETGGRLFEVSKKMPLEAIFTQIQDELRNQYNIGYAPSDAGGGFRQIKLRTKNDKLEVQTRAGYYPRPS